MASFLSPDEKHAVKHDENTSNTDESLAQRGPAVAEISHSEAPIWEQRETYGKSGFVGIFTSKYVFLCAAFATTGGLLFGYDQGVVSITLVMPQFLQQFPQVSPTASGAGFQKGLMTAMIELSAFIGALNQGRIAVKIPRKWSLRVERVLKQK